VLTLWLVLKRRAGR